MNFFNAEDAEESQRTQREHPGRRLREARFTLYSYCFDFPEERMAEKGVDIAPAEGKLGVLLVGLGAVSTTLVAGVESIKRGISDPIGSLTQMGTIRLGKRTDNRVPKIKDFVPLADLN